MEHVQQGFPHTNSKAASCVSDDDDFDDEDNEGGGGGGGGGGGLIVVDMAIKRETRPVMIFPHQQQGSILCE